MGSGAAGLFTTSVSSFQRPILIIPATPPSSTARRHVHRLPSTTLLKPLKATNGKEKSTKTNSIVCADCEGNGAIVCSQCEGTGVNSVDHFNGQFKAGGLCWLCRGKREILCGSCNGAGFLGGFMSTFED